MLKLEQDRDRNSLRDLAQVKSARDPLTLQQLRYREDAAQDDRANRADRTQLFSLLARFHEISSPMVELVLETGCL